ncbi:MAG: cation:proton antiporter [Candidatus Thermoplasmatota archaeon]|nr:cation:proton antiporter [Candidatus Thermoplasmatota archaeon]
MFDKLNQPSVIGEILAGFLVGSFGLGMLSNYNVDMNLLGYHLAFNLPEINFASGDFKIFADIGILFLLFISGLETDIFKMKKMGKAATFTAVAGVVVPLILGIFAGFYFGFSWEISIVIGLTLVATSVGITVRTLMNLDKLDSNFGITILGAAVIDDVIGIILLAFILGGSPLDLSIKILIYFLIFFYIGLKIIDKILALGDKLRLPKSLLSISLAILFIYTFFADKAGITGIIGGFVAGLLIGNTVIGSGRIKQDIHVIGEGLFIPLFFVWVGASVDLSAFLSVGFFALVIIIISIVGKIIGCSLGARLAGLKGRDSLLVGVGMIPRLEMAIVTVSIAINHEIIVGQNAHKILATTILVCIITAIITPPMLKAMISRYNK